MDVKDTVHKAPFILHLVELVIEKFPGSSDLYGDLAHTHRVAKVGAHSSFIIMEWSGNLVASFPGFYHLPTFYSASVN